MVWIAYNILFAIGFTLLLPRFLFRMARRGGYRKHFEQRFARYDTATLAKLSRERHVWIHAVSVGEMFVALKLMEEWRARRPEIRFAVTTTTSTGHALAAKRMSSEDTLLYFPVDFPFIARRALDTIRPLALILVEIELWPNLIRLANHRAVPIALVNARVSDRSFRGYRALRFVSRRLLPMIHLFCAQTRLDAERLIALGAPKHRVVVLGSAKYDVAAVEPGGELRAREVLLRAGITEQHRILLGGSTWPGEEDALMDVYKGLKTRHRNLVLVLVPRHVERAEEIARRIRENALTFVRRSRLEERPLASAPQVLLVDTTGELKNLYACADVIFIGKSLTQHGGQNPIEAAVYGKAIICGPNMENFRGVMDDFRSADAIVQVNDLQGLRRACDELLSNAQRRAALGERAARLVAEKQGVIDATLDLIDRALENDSGDDA